MGGVLPEGLVVSLAEQADLARRSGARSHVCAIRLALAKYLRRVDLSSKVPGGSEALTVVDQLRVMGGDVAVPILVAARRPDLARYALMANIRESSGPIEGDSVAELAFKIGDVALGVGLLESASTGLEISVVTVDRTFLQSSANHLELAGAKVLPRGFVLRPEGSWVLTDDTQDPACELVAGHLGTVFPIRDETGRCVLRNRPLRSRSLDSAVLIENRLAGSYFHDLIETAPLALRADRAGEGVMLISAALTEPVRDLLEQLLPSTQFVEHLDDEEFSVGRLLAFRAINVVTESVGGSVRLRNWDLDSLVDLRERALAIIDEQAPTRRIFVKRPEGLARGLDNAEEIRDWCVSQGFACVDPSSLSIREQIALFASAAVIVAEGGGALANLLFATKGAFLVLISGRENVGHELFPTVARIAGVRVIRVPATHIEDRARFANDNDFRHSRIRVSLEQVVKAVRTAEQGLEA